MFLRSNLHDTFLHSIFRPGFVKRFGDTVRYAGDGPHHNVTAYADALDNLMARQIDETFLLQSDAHLPGNTAALTQLVLVCLQAQPSLPVTLTCSTMHNSADLLMCVTEACEWAGWAAESRACLCMSNRGAT